MNNSASSLKQLFLIDPKVIFLNHGSFGATPRPVFEVLQQWQLDMESQPVEFLGRRVTSLLAESRSRLADYLGTERDNIVYTTNATTGLNTVVRSLDLKRGDVVLTTDHEYGALDRTWQFLSQKNGFQYVNVPISTPLISRSEFVGHFWSHVTPAVKVIFLSHITSPTALIFPVKEICTLARQHGILTVIDGAHAPGQIPLNLDDIGADVYCGNLHKWLCAPKGAAFLFVRPEIQPRIEPLVVSWGWQSDTPGPSRFVDHQEWTGTRDFSAFLSVPSAMDFQAALEWKEVRHRCHLLASETRARIASLTGVQPIQPDSDEWFAQMCASPLPAGTDVAALKTDLYDRFHIEIPVHLWNGIPLIRYSFQGYNSPEDVDSLMYALETLL